MSNSGSVAGGLWRKHIIMPMCLRGSPVALTAVSIKVLALLLIAGVE